MARTLTALAALLALAGCGPYNDVAQRLDVSATILEGDTWIGQVGPEVRLLILGKPERPGEKAAFALASMDLSIAAGISGATIEGLYSEDAQGQRLTFAEQLRYTLPDERSLALLSRHGVRRSDIAVALGVDEVRAGAQLTLTGDASFAGTYLKMADALSRLGTAAASDAVCAFLVANLAVRSSEARVLYFGSAAMTQYGTTASFAGIFAGAMQVHADVSVPSFASTTTISYSQFADFAGVHLDGAQITKADGSGDGRMSGVLRFALQQITGSIDYGSADAIVISSGNPTGGHYSVAIDGGGQTQLSPAQPASPSLRQCLGLP
jgi:hypothetical protein